MKKERETANKYRQQALEGDLMAMNNMGVCYAQGIGVVEDHVMAFQWYMKAAELGDIYACYNVAECYYQGDGVEQDFERALHWYLIAAEKGDVQSQVNAANAFYLGQGTKEDHVTLSSKNHFPKLPRYVKRACRKLRQALSIFGFASTRVLDSRLSRS